MNKIMNLVDEIASEIGLEVCMDIADRVGCGSCPYENNCSNGNNGAIKRIKQIVDLTIKEDEE